MGNGSSAAAGLRERDGGEATAVALTRRHFVAQDRRPDHLGVLDLTAVEPELRNLLFTDGTVTRSLEAQTLSPVWVDVVDQRRAPVEGGEAAGLAVGAGAEAIRRRVAIGVGVGATLIWAESHIVPERLPEGFLNVLGDSPEGIGQSLREVQLESWREMLWFGLDSVPAWAAVDEKARVLRRLYRVIALGRPAMLISECFAVELRAGSYGLPGA